MESLRSDEETPRSGGVISRTVQLTEMPTLRTALALAESPRTFWAAPGEATVVGSGTAKAIEADGPNRFQAVMRAAEELFSEGDVHARSLAARPRLFGGFAFHDEHTNDETWSGYPGARFVLPERQVTYTDNDAWLTVNAIGESVNAVEEDLKDAHEQLRTRSPSSERNVSPGIVSRSRTTSKDAWKASVTAATDRIRAGELQKVVFAQALQTKLASPLSIPDILIRLGTTYPDCYRFLFEPHERSGSFFGATPERLVGLRGRTVETGALAGTTGRGETPEEDEWLAKELLADEKNGHEHDLVVGAIREQLKPHAASIKAEAKRIRRLATVQHIETPITAKLAEDEHILTLVEALHPTPAVGGLPPDKALATIRDTEPFERGWYAAPVGWFDAAGYGSFVVAIRSAIAHGDLATLFAGVGIVGDSDPDREWDEVQLKYRPILDALE